WPLASSIDTASGLRRRRQPRLMLFRELNRLAADGVVAAQRIPDPVVGHEDSRQLGMPAEDDSEQVVRLALVPVGGREQVVHRVDLGRLAVDADALIGYGRCGDHYRVTIPWALMRACRIISAFRRSSGRGGQPGM